MVMSFGDFKLNEISELIWNKDHLGLNMAIESYSTIKKKSEEPLNMSDANKATDAEESEMEYVSIPHYLKPVANFNNNADINNKENTENTSPTLQTNNPIINRPLHSVSSGNLAQNVLFKSFKNIQQSCKRSQMNSHKNQDEIPGTSSDQTDLIIWSDSNELIEDFYIKTREITKAMQEFHFIATDLRNKLSKGRVNNNCPIITGKNNTAKTSQVRVEIYPHAKSCLREIRGFLHKEMNLCIKSSYYEALCKNEIFPAGQSCSSCPNLMSDQQQIETIVTLRKNQAIEM